MERAFISVLMEEFMDDSLELDNFILQSTSAAAFSSLAVLACFDKSASSRSSENHSQVLNDDDIPSSPEPPRKKRKRGRGRGGTAGSSRKRGRKLKSYSLTFEKLAECVIPRYSDIAFKSHFGMSRVTFEEICCMIAPSLSYRTVKTEKKLLLTLWILISRESYGSVSERFDVSKGCLHGICGSVCSALSALEKEFIQFPSESDLDDVANEFYNWCYFPGVVGIIGCTHIPIREPIKDAEDFINKEGSFSVQLQIVCDSQLKLLHVHTGSPGSQNSAEVFYNSSLFAFLEVGTLPSSMHILGDCSYPLRPNLLVPFDEERSESQRKFNQRLAETCSKVEVVIKLIKKKFQRLKFIDMKQVDDISKVVKAACILFNIILFRENVTDVDQVELAEGGDEFEVDLSPEPYLLNNEASEIAIRKRHEIAESLWTVTDR